MVDFQERITQETEPAIRVEHEVRYSAVAPLVAGAPAWVDLGCGTGLAARAAVARGRPPKITIVDIDEDAVNEAARGLGEDVVAIVADLSDSRGLQTVRAAIDEGAVVTCFETVEHLAVFIDLVELLVELAAERGVTAVLSVPNDAFTGVDNPHHMTTWGDGAVAELRGLLPEDHVVAHQLALAGSVMAVGEEPRSHAIDVATTAPQAPPTHFIIAFGPRIAELEGAAAAAQVDAAAQRAWERQRSADLAYFRVRTAQRDELAAQLDETVRQLEEFRAYIHELETRLGIPLSGTGNGAGTSEKPADTAGPTA
jgi:SAM-dependent methyltransferase